MNYRKTQIMLALLKEVLPVCVWPIFFFVFSIKAFGWEPYPDKCALMTIHAHADDEGLFFGGTLPFYARVRNLPVIDVMMTISSFDGSQTRINELREACKAYGLRYEPVIGPFAQNVHTGTLQQVWNSWGGKEKAVGYIVKQLRRFKPDVVVTHDLKGEYNNPDHSATAIAVTEACKLSGDPTSYPDSGAPWTIKKCYVHLYKQNPFYHSWDDPMEALGGKTARQVGEEALKKHVSQWGWVAGGFRDSTEYWGLYYTTVGPDIIAKNNFFENVDISIYPNAYPDPYATKTALQNYINSSSYNGRGPAENKGIFFDIKSNSNFNGVILILPHNNKGSYNPIITLNGACIVTSIEKKQR